MDAARRILAAPQQGNTPNAHEEASSEEEDMEEEESDVDAYLVKVAIRGMRKAAPSVLQQIRNEHAQCRLLPR